MEFNLNSIDYIRSICKDYKKYDGVYVGEDFEGNMSLTEVYPEYIYVKVFLDRGIRNTYFYIDGRTEETYSHY